MDLQGPLGDFMGFGGNLRLGALAVWGGALLALGSTAFAAQPVEEYATSVQPVLAKYCYDCHADGVNKGRVALDQFKTEQDIHKNPELWWKVLKNVRAGLMPPQKKDRPDDAEKQRLYSWIKYGAMGIDPADPDPGRTGLRRLNRAEYRNTVRALTGVDFNTTEEFPPDDTGYGFDTIGDVLNVSPMLLEKYMQAAELIVTQAVPTVSKVAPETVLYGGDFLTPDGAEADVSRMTFYKPVDVNGTFTARHAGEYKIVLNLVVHGAFDFDPGQCEMALTVDDVEKWRQPFKWESGKKFRFEVPMKWEPGEHRLAIALKPLTPVAKKRTSVDMELASVNVQGPLEEKFWVAPPNYRRYFSRDEAPTDPTARRAYAREVLGAFAKRAFRRPAGDAVVDRLARLAEAEYSQEGKRFEDGIRSSMVAILSSPRFLFRVEEGVTATPGAASTPVDEYTLASRLSYFLWSSTPDDELTSLADRNLLRKNLSQQVSRMLKDLKSQALVRNFAGQWLELRDVEGVQVNARIVQAQDAATTRPATAGAAPARGLGFGRPTIDLDGPMRDAMRREPEMLFSEIIREDRNVAELLDTDHTYLNEALARLYKINGIKGAQMRRVDLPADSPRGGILTTGAFLAVTSNPTRTSPVKRGQFILDNILGMPAPPPPPDVPALEEAEKSAGQVLSFREALELHRNKALCRSCHARMDPLGLSLENFNAMGMFREKERGFPIDASGKLVTGETFHDARELKHVLRTRYANDFYRCLTEKMFTYALGRGLTYGDVESVDRVVDRMVGHDGHFSELLNGIVESTPFQRRRTAAPTDRAIQARGADPRPTSAGEGSP
jgi:hypothetical protein